MKSLANLALLLEGFFMQRLMAQRQASSHTISSYRDTFRLLLSFAEKRLKRPPSRLALEDLGAPLITSFLDELENKRANGARSRNLRLAAIRSFFRYAALEAPEHSALIQRVLSIPSKRHTRPLIDFLVRPEIEALLAAPSRQTWIGQRDILRSQGFGFLLLYRGPLSRELKNEAAAAEKGTLDARNAASARLGPVMSRAILAAPIIVPRASRMGETVRETSNLEPSFRWRTVW